MVLVHAIFLPRVFGWLERGVRRVILGTVARSGLAGLFIGNTAERVLEGSNTDVMVVKQADFRSPIQIDPAESRGERAQQSLI